MDITLRKIVEEKLSQLGHPVEQDEGETDADRICWTFKSVTEAIFCFPRSMMYY